MSAISDILGMYGNVASPEDLRNMANIMVANASVQDDAIPNAVKAAMGVESAGRDNLEKYMLAAEEQAKGEAEKALQMAQQRLSAIDQNETLLSSTVGLGREGKQKLASLEAERKAILEAFPQLGKASEGAVAEIPAFDIKEMLGSKNYSPDMIKRMFEEGTSEDWDEAIRSGDLDLYQAMLDGKLGALPDGIAEKMRFVVGGLPQTSKALKLDSRYSRLRSVLGETQGDLKKKAKEDSIAAQSKKENGEKQALLESLSTLKDQYLGISNERIRKKFLENHPDFANNMKLLKDNNKLKGDELNALSQFLGR